MTPEEIVAFWLEEIGPSGWYKSDESLDTQIRDRFLATWQDASEGAHGFWLSSATGGLAYLILTDQFPRNMFRGSGDAFATDKSAVAVAYEAIEKGWDMMVPEPERQFFYMPMMHSEDLGDQDACVSFMTERLVGAASDNLRHARAHRHIIRQFGRFPYRNAALGRENTPAEDEWVKNDGYPAALRAVDENSLL